MRLATLAICAIVIVLAGLLGGPGRAFDEGAIVRLASLRHDSPMLTQLAIALSMIGSAWGTIGLSLIGGLWLWARGLPRHGLLLAGAVVAERMFTDTVKLIVARPRPAVDLHPVATHSWSFPSGHSANSLTAFTLFALIAVPSRWRGAALALLVPVALLTGLSRPYLGVHWPSDVIAGWAVAVAAITIALAARERRLLAHEAQHEVVARHRPALGEGEAAR